MKEFFPFPSINDFSKTIKQVVKQSEYYNVTVPTIKFRGTVKLHGTNAGVVFKDGEIYPQSRERVISIDSDNAGFAMFVERNKESFQVLFRFLNVHSFFGESIQLYGEWCGGNIQKSVGLNKLDKMFVIFACRISEGGESTKPERWIDIKYIESIVKYNISNPNIFTITQFPTFELDIDFNNPKHYQNKLIELTEQVEKDCPVTRHFLPESTDELVGEGLVWEAVETFNYGFPVNDMRFKTKGHKHSISKVKVLVPVDIEKVNSINEFVEKVVTENRLKQGLDKMREMGLELSRENTSAYIKWVMGDVMKEEYDTLVESGFTTKEVTGPITQKARNFFFENLV